MTIMTEKEKCYEQCERLAVERNRRKRLDLPSCEIAKVFEQAIEEQAGKCDEYMEAPYNDMLLAVRKMKNEGRDRIYLTGGQINLAANALKASIDLETSESREEVLCHMYNQLTLSKKEYSEVYGGSCGVPLLTANSSTVSAAIVNGIPIVSPNRVLYTSDEPVEYGGKEYGGFYISYNNHDTDIYGCDTTAIVIGQMQGFFILNGNHSGALDKAAHKGGFDACLNYFREHEDEMNERSDNPFGNERSDQPLNNEAPKR